jgi:competence protein ComEC
MMFGGAATLIGLVLEPLGRVVGWGAYLWLTWTIRVVEWTASFPYASIAVELSDGGLIAIYASIGIFTLFIRSSPERRRAMFQGLRARWRPKVALGAVALVTLVAWLAVLQFPDDKLRVAFLDVGQGDAVFIKTPAGAQILIDGGPEGSALLSELGRQMPFWDRTLDLVVLTHPDADHLTGLIAVLERYGVGAVVSGALSYESDLVDTWEAALASAGPELIHGQTGTHLELSDGVTLDVLHPGAGWMGAGRVNTNNDSVVLRLSYRDVAFLLPGDIEAEVERELVHGAAYLHSNVLKVPHHGSETSSSQAFLAATRPQVAVISVGQDNRFGHPAQEVLNRLDGMLVYRTDQHGTVTITSDGHRLWINTER